MQKDKVKRVVKENCLNRSNTYLRGIHSITYIHLNTEQSKYIRSNDKARITKHITECMNNKVVEKYGRKVVDTCRKKMNKELYLQTNKWADKWE